MLRRSTLQTLTFLDPEEDRDLTKRLVPKTIIMIPKEIS
jgi:hypothetical protein